LAAINKAPGMLKDNCQEEEREKLDENKNP
jgi:hypothetical protein